MKTPLEVDQVIFEQAIKAMEEHYGSGCETEIDAYYRGAKWMLSEMEKIKFNQTL